jgi:hypothetical protein
MRLRYVVYIVIVLCCYSIVAPTTNAASGLANVIAQVNSNALLEATEMTVRFNLPNDSPPIRKSDYVQIYLAEFSNLTVPQLTTGDHAGTPLYSVSGQYIRITNFRLEPNGHIEFSGINLTSPASEDQFQVVVMVTEDEAGTLVKNYANVIATRNYGSVTVNASIPAELSSLIISGLTGPYTFLIFSQANSVMGTDTSNSLGQFSKMFSGLQPTTHNITFYGIDQDNRVTSPIPISVYTPAFQQTQVSSQLLSPTIEINTSSFLQGDQVIATGSAIPGGNVTLFTDNPLRSYQASSSATGEWTYSITNTDEYIPGDYRMYAIVQDQYGLQSLFSPSLFFSLRTTATSGTACGDISTADLNCDGEHDLTDFSILMYYWGTTNEAADVNADGVVNLPDFSVLMYYWGN